MKSRTTNRRQLLVGLAGAGLAAFIPGSGAAQQNTNQSKSPFSPTDLGSIHGDTLNNISEKLGGTPINTEPGFHKIVDLLWDWKIIDAADKEQLDKLIDVIFNAANSDEMAKKIAQIYDESVKKAGEVAATVSSIARNSFQWAIQKYKEHPRIVRVVSSDVLGALNGATIGRKLGPKFAPLGALAGAIAESSKTAFEAKT